MRWKAQQVLWPTPPTFLLYHHLPTPLCIFWVLWAIHTLQMKSRPCCPSWWGGYVLLRCVLTMPGWSRQSQTHAELAGVPGLLPPEISRALSAAVQCSCPELCRWHMEFEQESTPEPPTDTCVRTLPLNNMPEVGYHFLNSFQLLTALQFHATHEIPKWCFFLACRVCLSSVWQNKKIRNRSE